MPVVRFDTTISIVGRLKAYFRLEGGLTLGQPPKSPQELSRELASAQQIAQEQQHWLKQQDREISRLKKQLGNADHPVDDEDLRRPRKSQSSTDLPFREGSLPNYVIIGAQKGGTTSLHNLLSGHPHVMRPTTKEIHFFDNHYDEGLGWYRAHFRPPVEKNGYETITGEASPYYIASTSSPERMARIVPDIKLIAMLRNPVDRAYSHYQASARHGREPLDFEQAIEAEEKRLREERERALANDGAVLSIPQRHSYLGRGIYVNQIKHWHRYFDPEQLLIVKSEDFFTDPLAILRTVLEFLDLSEWEPSETRVSNKGDYGTSMSDDTRRWLQDYFEPHNQSLYDYLGRDFGWE